MINSSFLELAEAEGNDENSTIIDSKVRTNNAQRCGWESNPRFYE